MWTASLTQIKQKFGCWKLLCVGGVKFAPYLRSDGVLDADHDDAGELVQDVVLTVPVRLSRLRWKVPVSHADGPQPVTRHWLNHFTHHLVTVLRLEDTRLTLGVQDTRASGKDERDRGGGGRSIGRVRNAIHYPTHPFVTPSYHPCIPFASER